MSVREWVWVSAMLLQGIGFISLAVINWPIAFCVFMVMWGYGIQMRLNCD
jgi:hypothetical protein